jgi:glycosyltransferase involved in cell wall biosynthesis
MPKILHVAETVKGGISTVISSLVKAEFDTYCIIPYNQASCLDARDVKIFGYSGGGRGLYLIYSMCFQTLFLVRKLKPDIVHLHSSFSLICAPFLKLFFRKLKVVYQPHGVYYDPNVPRSALKLGLIRFVEKLLVLFVDQVISISEYEMSLLQDVHSNTKLVLLKNSAAPSRIDFESQRVRNGYLFVGRLDEQKGIDELLRFWAQMGPADVLNVVGDAVRSEFFYTVSSNVKFHGWVSSSQLDEFYSSAKAVVVPSRWEGFGLVVIEAYRNGTPVIASDRGALPELVKEGVTGYIFPFDRFDTGLSSRLNELPSRGDVEKMYESCFKEYVDHYSIEGYVKKYEHLMEELLYVS